MHLSPVTVRSTYNNHGHLTQPHPPDPRRVSRDGEDVHRLRQRGHRQDRAVRSMRAAPSHGVGARPSSALEEKRPQSTWAPRNGRVQLVREATWSQPASRLGHRRKRQTTAADRSLPAVPPTRRGTRVGERRLDSIGSGWCPSAALVAAVDRSLMPTVQIVLPCPPSPPTFRP